MSQVVTFEYGNDKITVEKIPINLHPGDNVYQSLSKVISSVVNENMQNSGNEIIVLEIKNKKFIITNSNYGTVVCEVCFELIEKSINITSVELYKVKFDIDFSNLFNNYKII